MRITVDESGKIKLPEEFFKEMEITKGSALNIYMDYYLDEIIIRKLYPGCIFCNCGVELVNINHKYICVHCIEILKNAKTGDSFCVPKIN